MRCRSAPARAGAARSKVHLREAHVQPGAQVARREGTHLVETQLPGIDRRLRHAFHDLRPERPEVGAIDLEQDERALSGHRLLLGLRVERRAGHERLGPAEIGEQLSDGHAGRESIVDHRIIQAAGGNAAAILRRRPSDAAKRGRKIGGAGFPDHFARRARRELRGLDLRVVLQRGCSACASVSSAGGCAVVTRAPSQAKDDRRP